MDAARGISGKNTKVSSLISDQHATNPNPPTHTLFVCPFLLLPTSNSFTFVAFTHEILSSLTTYPQWPPINLKYTITYLVFCSFQSALQ